MLPAEVITEDATLEAASSSTAEALARHRWHWTLDESNAGRVSVREYATAVNRGRTTIGSMVKGFARWQETGGRSGPTTLNESINRAAMSSEKEAVTEAVAEARGIGITQVRKTRPAEVARVRELARDRAEAKGTTVEEEARTIAEFAVKAERSDAATLADRRARLGMRFIELEETLRKASRHLLKAVNQAHAVAWGDEEQELLAETVANVRRMIGLIDLGLGGTADVDWDAELASLTEGINE